MQPRYAVGVTGRSPPPPAPSLEHVSEGQFILYEDPLTDTQPVDMRRVVLWDVAPREVLLARGAIDFRVERRIPARDVVGVGLEPAGEGGRVSVTLQSGERVDLFEARPLRQVEAMAELVARVTKAKLTRG